MREIFDETNYNHNLLGTQQTLDQAAARHVLFGMLKDGDISDSNHQKANDWIDKYVTKEENGVLNIKIGESKPDLNGDKVEVYLGL